MYDYYCELLPYLLRPQNNCSTREENIGFLQLFGMVHVWNLRIHAIFALFCVYWEFRSKVPLYCC